MKKTSKKVSEESSITYERLDSTDRQSICDAIRRGWSRRDVIKMIMATGVTASIAPHIYAGGQAALAATPKKGGTVRAATRVHGPNDSLDPNLPSSAGDWIRGRAMYNGLIQFGEGLTTNPELAESFSPNADASEWTFKLRKDVVFHDGKPMTADDVVYSLNRHLGEDSTSKMKSVFASVKGWRKSGPYEVKAEMNTPNADLPSALGLFGAKIIQADSNGGIGTGPFTLESFEPGVKSVLKRNPNYWREGANLDALELTAITDPVARVNALVAGDMQMVSFVEPTSFKQVEESPRTKLNSTPAGQQIAICCLKSTAPGSSDDFVNAMRYIQDREHVVKRLLKGRGTIGNDQPIAPAHGSDWCAELPQREYDPDKAKFLFEKSGFSSAEIHVAPVAPAIEQIALLAQANCAKIGFDLKIKKVPAEGYYGAVWSKEPINVANWNMRPTANAQIAVQFAPGAAWNDTHWHNERMGELLKLSLSELDPDKRHAMYCEMQTLIHEHSGIVVPAFSNVNDGLAKNVMGVPKIPIGPLGGCEFPEFVWLA